jgi:hypothetical protein
MARAPNKVMEFLGVFCMVWAQHRRYKPNVYFPTDRDKGSVKRFIVDSPELPSLGEVARRARIFLDDEYWASGKHPAHGLFNQFNRYIPKPDYGAHREDELGPVILCGVCGEAHNAYSRCTKTGD